MTEGIRIIRELREEFWRDLRVLGSTDEFNQDLEKAGRIADYLELAELMCVDALDRDESCGAHFREEHQTTEGEAMRDDDNWLFVSAWEHGRDGTHIRHDEPLSFTHIPLATRNYK